MIGDMAAGHARLPLERRSPSDTPPAVITSGDALKRRAIGRGYAGYGLRPAPTHPLPILTLIVAALAS
jgi:hypothetical protein